MKIRFLLLLVISMMLTAGAWAAPDATPAATPAAKAKKTKAPKAKGPPFVYELTTATLPGKGLAQHDFLFTGEFDTRKPVATISLVQGGKVTKTYQIPTKNPENGELSEYSDIHRLSNGDIVYAYKTGWSKVDQDGKMIYNFTCPQEKDPTSGKMYYRECHSAQPIGMDKVLFMLNGAPAKLCLYNIKTGKMEMEHVMNTKNPADSGGKHGQFRNVRMTKAGTYLIAHMDLNKVIEYDKDWKEIWSCDAPSVWHACRLKNGNTLIGGNQNAFAREIDKDGKTVWEFGNADLKGTGITLFGVHQAIRLDNGNTVLTNWVSGRLGGKANYAKWPKTVQLIEVTPDKKVVWALREWTDPDLGTSSCVQMLDDKGNEEDQDLQR